MNNNSISNSSDLSYQQLIASLCDNSEEFNLTYIKYLSCNEFSRLIQTDGGLGIQLLSNVKKVTGDSDFKDPNLLEFVRKRFMKSDHPNSQAVSYLESLDVNTKEIRFEGTDSIDCNQNVKPIKKALKKFHSLERLVFKDHPELSREDISKIILSICERKSFKAVQMFNCKKITENDLLELKISFEGIQFHYNGNLYYHNKNKQKSGESMNINTSKETAYNRLINNFFENGTELDFDIISTLTKDEFMNMLNNDGGIGAQFLPNVRKIRQTGKINSELFNLIVKQCPHAETEQKTSNYFTSFESFSSSLGGDLKTGEQIFEKLNCPQSPPTICDSPLEKYLDKLDIETQEISFNSFSNLTNEDFLDLPWDVFKRFEQLESIEFRNAPNIDFGAITMYLDILSKKASFKRVIICNCDKITFTNILQWRFVYKGIKFAYTKTQNSDDGPRKKHKPDTPFETMLAKLQSDAKALIFSLNTKHSDEVLLKAVEKGAVDHLNSVETIAFKNHPTVSIDTVATFLERENFEETVKTVDIHNCPGISEKDYITLQSLFPKVQFFYYTPKPTDGTESTTSMIAHLMKMLENTHFTLRSLSFEHIPDMTPDHLVMIEKHLEKCTELKELSFEGCKNIKSEVISELMKKLPLLKTNKPEDQTIIVSDDDEIKLSDYADFLTEDCTDFISSHIDLLGKVETLFIDDVPNLTKVGLLNILKHTPHLNRVVVNGSTNIIDDEVLENIPKLEFLELNNCLNVTGDFLKKLASNPPLIFIFKDCQNITETALKQLSSLKISELQFENIPGLTNTILKSIESHHYGDIVVLSKCPNITDEGVIAFLNAYKNRLTYIDITHNPQLTNAVLGPILEIDEDLDNLMIAGCPKIDLNLLAALDSGVQVDVTLEDTINEIE